MTSSATSGTHATGQAPSQPTDDLLQRYQRNRCALCKFGLIEPVPPLTKPLRIVEERTQQYEAGLLHFCDCEMGQATARYYARMSVNPYGKQLADEAASRRIAFLERIDGLKPAERLMTLATYRVGRHNRAAVDAVRAGIEKGTGLVTLTGEYGVGKSALLIAAINECRRKDWTSMYTTVADLLAWLRESFSPDIGMGREGIDESYQRRWQLLTTCQCLALDELTAFSVTPWAAERFERLIDERWRSMGDRLTVCAMNGNIEESNLPGVVLSRLNDRRARLIQIDGVDMRRVYRGD